MPSIQTAPLDPADLDWIGVRFLDPIGRVFHRDGNFYRAIYPDQVDYAAGLLENDTIKGLMDEGLLVKTEIAPLSVDGYGLVLAHEQGFRGCPPANWSREQLRRAGEVFLEINRRLLDIGHGLLDGHLGNMAQFANGQPKWIDFGSITSFGNGSRCQAGLNNYKKSLHNPLRLMGKSPDLIRLARTALASGGLGDEELHALEKAFGPGEPAPDTEAPSKPEVSDESTVSGGILSRFFGKTSLSSIRADEQAAPPKKKSAKKKSGSKLTPEERARRKAARKRAREERRAAEAEAQCVAAKEKHRQQIESLLGELRGDFPVSESRWGKYHSHLEGYDADQPGRKTGRIGAILQLLEDRPKGRLIDLASNAGYFSLQAVSMGYSVVALDYDEAAIDRLAGRLMSQDRDVDLQCGVCDLTAFKNPTFKADVVLALALVHHLSLTQKFPFSFIAEMLASYCEGDLIVEFMPNGLGGTEPKPNPLPEGYTLENFRRELHNHFDKTEVIEYERIPGHSIRDLILCTGRKENEQ